jgi:hypothetical protein
MAAQHVAISVGSRNSPESPPRRQADRPHRSPSRVFRLRLLGAASSRSIRRVRQEMLPRIVAWWRPAQSDAKNDNSPASLLSAVRRVPVAECVSTICRRPQGNAITGAGKIQGPKVELAIKVAGSACDRTDISLAGGGNLTRTVCSTPTLHPPMAKESSPRFPEADCYSIRYR